MFGYYIDLAVRSLLRNKVLTALMVLTLGLGIGASMTTLTVQRLLSGDPVPEKSERLFHPRINPRPREGYAPGQVTFAFTYIDVMNLLHEHEAERQAPVAISPVKVVLPGSTNGPFFGNAVLTTTDFFTMFDVPFEYGGGWSAPDDDGGSNVIVIADALNEKWFGGADSVGKSVRINDRDFRIVGVLKPWSPQPRFYGVDLDGRAYGDGESLFLPLQSGLAAQMGTPDINCWSNVDQDKLKIAPCVWLSYWVQLADADSVVRYKNYLDSYARAQMRQGRFYRDETALPNLRQFLHDVGVVPDTVKLKTGLSFGFLLICVVNTVGLLLAKCLRRSSEIGIRRALGATRGAIFAQFMIEAAIIGVAGGLLGLCFAELGLWGIRHQPSDYASLAYLNAHMFLMNFIVALSASLIAGLLPAWRASDVAPAIQVKAG